MTEDLLDPNEPISGAAKLRALVRFVEEADPNQESDWLEWKAGLDLSTKRHQFGVSKQILGLANREPGRAALHAGGRGFLVLGAEPGRVPGQAGIDPADLEDGIGRYVGTADGPAWTPTLVRTTDADVWVIAVEAPTQGDRIFTLRKEYDDFREGTIFVRRKGGTHQANAAEVEMLTDRLQTPKSAKTISIGVTANDSASVAEFEARTAMEESVLTGVEDLLLRPLASSRAQGRGDEARSTSTYKEEVRAYTVELGGWTRFKAMAAHFSSDDSTLMLSVTNPTEENLRAVEVVLELPEGVIAFTSVPRPGVPERPRLWHDLSLRTFSNDAWRVTHQVPIEVPSSVSLQRAEAGLPRRITLKPVDLRPEATKTLSAGGLLLDPDVGSRMREVAVRWSATATNRTSVATGVLSLPVEAVPLNPGPHVPDLLRD